MAKKRKAGRLSDVTQDRDAINEAGSKLQINTFEDVADSEDEFHINRDKILLEEEPAQKRQRRAQEEGQYMLSLHIPPSRSLTFAIDKFFEPSDEEVLPESEDASESDDELQDEIEDSQAVHQSIIKKTTLSQFGKTRDSDLEDDAAPKDDPDLAGWGPSKKDYYNADAIETEADALEEEAEARRLQQKQLQGMTEEDFGFDEVDWLEAGKGDDGEEEGQDNVIREVLPKLEITDAMGPEERMKILRVRYPEFELLAKEFLDLQESYEDLQSMAVTAVAVQVARQQEADREKDVPMPLAAVKHSALSSYLAALSMYFALFTCGTKDSEGRMTAMASEELKEHSVMETLVKCRDLWENVKIIEVPQSSIVMPAEGSQERVNGTADPSGLAALSKEKGLRPRKHKQRKNKAQRAAEASQAEADARRAERIRQTEEELASLSHLPALSKKPTPSRQLKTPSQPHDDSDSDFGEQTTLTPHEAAEKAKRKKSLRFYTSQIAQKANKRDTAGRDAGGDVDIPYRERLKDRQERLNAEAESRGKKTKDSSKGAPLGGSSDEADHTTAQAMREDEAGGSDDYYDLVSSRTAAKKASKVAQTEALKAGKIVRFEDDEAGADGKRAISYAIEKNKGLIPKRKKDVRNPRVKKRKKFEEKKKKLGSVRAVYKGGEGRGGYGGEKTGIKKGLVKSVKL